MELPEISEIIKIIIWLSAGAGLLCAWKAHHGISKEKLKLSQFKDSPVEAGGSPEQRKNNLKDWLSAQSGKRRQKKPVELGDAFHLELRLSTICDSISTSNDTRILPTLHDLHNLTMQDETSRGSATALRTITSFLLILGILGTLTGIHMVVNNDMGTLEVSKLDDALEPSIWAVASTVLLMWLRGWYVARRDSYVEELDLYTITHVIPMYQPVSKVGAAGADLAIIINQLGKRIPVIETNAKEMEMVCQSINRIITTSSQVAQDVAAKHQDMKTLNETLQQTVQTANDYLQGLETSMAENTQTGEKIIHNMQELKHEADSLKEQLDTAYSHYYNLSKSLNTACDDLLSRQENIERLRNYAARLDDTGNQVKEYSAALMQLNASSQNVESTMEAMGLLKNEIENSANSALDSSKHAQDALMATQNIVEALSSENEQFAAHMEQNRKDFETALSELSSSLEIMSKEANGVLTEFKHRRQALHL